MKELRKEHGWTLLQLARLTTINLTKIWRLEEGLHNPKLHEARKISRALGVTIDDIAWPERNEKRRVS